MQSHCILAAWVVILCGSLVHLLLSITIKRGYEMVTVFGDEDPKQQRGLLVFDPKSIMYKNSIDSHGSSSCTICSDVPSR